MQYGDQIASNANELNVPFISAFVSGNPCSSPTCRAVVQSSLEATTNLLQKLEDITQQHEKKELQTELHLDAIQTLKNAYMAFNCPLAADDIQCIADKARVPCDIPGNHTDGSNGSEADDSEYTELSSTGL